MRVVETEAAPRSPDGVAAGSSDPDEPALVRERYARRIAHAHYSVFKGSALFRCRSAGGRSPTFSVHLVGPIWPVGCSKSGAAGRQLLEFLRLGFRPEHLQGIELLAIARKRRGAC
jgi:hypothetical protein